MIPVNRPLLAGNEKKYLCAAIDAGEVGQGAFIEAFEKQFATSVKRKYGIAVSSGTAALDIAVKALDISPLMEVIVPTFTIISCINQMVRMGIRPVFVDAHPETWTIDVEKIEQAITPLTRAIMPVHIYGLPCDMDPILKLAEHYDLKVIEDAAQAHGQTYYQNPCGSFGDLSTFSFYANKNITTGEGGMIVTDDAELASRCRTLRNLCFGARRFVHEEIGWNYRMSNLQAAVGLAQFEQLPQTLRRKKHIGKTYRERLDEHVQFQTHAVPHAHNHYWVVGVLCAKEASQVAASLADRGIQTRPFFYPLHQQPVLERSETHPVSERLYRHGLYLPSGVGTTDAEIDRVAEAVRESL